MKHLGLTILMYAAIVLQGGTGTSWAIGIARPDFLLAAWGVVLLTTVGRSALLWAGLAGLLADCLTDQPLGISVIVFALMTAVAGSWNRPRFDRSLFFLPVILLMILFPARVMVTAARVLVANRSVDVQNVLITDASIAIYSAAMVIGGVVLCRIVRRVLPSRLAGPAIQRTNRFRLLTK